MTSTSLGTQTPGLPQSLLAATCDNGEQGRRFGVQAQHVLGEEAPEALGAKFFPGQYTFKAPAADDFAKGLLPHRTTHTPGGPVPETAGMTTGLVTALKVLLGVSR
ncbi:hypothetical protein JTY93_16885 [Pseudomonas hygromyciniae]|uniref:Uncharacterized protein n=1 Tax=Pseudomonas hygromyciniae TaxID=2812000 RepID=A0ABX7JSJ9_9PSED|nr:hypothetical protein [Pseudomonas hygromyciniae]MBN0977255.1 hypothetical protein [Pseudomonas hygromyciniae]QSB37978.1 hypothetical protein JTY93_16885 [Pseudomonas hygromyciniae]